MKSTWWPATREIQLPFKKGRPGRRRRRKGARGRGTLDEEKPPILGITKRNGDGAIRILSNIQQETIKPVIDQFVEHDLMIYTDEDDIDARLPQWGYGREAGCHGHGEYARDDAADGFDEVHANTMESCWSLLRSWRRPQSRHLSGKTAKRPGLLRVGSRHPQKGCGKSEKLLVGVIGFEPTTPSSRTRCATRLRYTPTGGETRKTASQRAAYSGLLPTQQAETSRLHRFAILA